MGTWKCCGSLLVVLPGHPDSAHGCCAPTCASGPFFPPRSVRGSLSFISCLLPSLAVSSVSFSIYHLWPVGHLWLFVSLVPCLNVCPSMSLCSFFCSCPSASIGIPPSPCAPVRISEHGGLYYVCVFSPRLSLPSLCPSLLLPDTGWSLSFRLTLPLAPPLGSSMSPELPPGLCSSFLWGQKSGCLNIWPPPGDSGSAGRRMDWLARGLPCSWGATDT